MSNPWEKINLDNYEKHMSSSEVYQLQKLNEIMKEQIEENENEYLAVLGVAGGNGLNNIDMSKTKKVYAIDINKNYLEICRQRYNYMGNVLEVLCGDLSDENFIVPKTNLLICNLIIEYIGEEEFVNIIDKNRNHLEVVSCVIQKNNLNSFVSNSDIDSEFNPILAIHHDIEEEKLKFLFSNIGFTYIANKKYTLPNGKEFIRIDFRNK